MPNTDTIRTETNALADILKKDWYALSAKNDKADGFETIDMIEGEARRWSSTNQVITKGPKSLLLSQEIIQTL